MKLKKFTPENCISEKGQHAGKPCIGISLKSGLLRINKQACELLQLKDGDQVLFHQDEEEPENWYIEKVKKDGFALRSKSNVTPGLLFNNTKLVTEIFSSVAFEGKGGKVLVANQPTMLDKTKLYGLLMNGLRNK